MESVMENGDTWAEAGPAGGDEIVDAAGCAMFTSTVRIEMTVARMDEIVRQASFGALIGIACRHYDSAREP